MLLPAAPETTFSRDQQHQFFQNTDLFYLTGFGEPSSALFLSNARSGPRSVLFVSERNKQVERWTGERLGTKRAKRRFKVDEVFSIADLRKELPALLAPHQQLYFSAGVDPSVDRLVWSLFSSSVNPRRDVPHTIIDARLPLSGLRLKKDRDEIRTIAHAVDITAHAMLKLISELKHLGSELHAAKQLEANFVELGATGPAFETIVASGKNATVLHHHPSHQPLLKRELVLIDCGARFNGYAGDITRVVPISGSFSPAQADVYDVVAAAVEAVIARVKPGTTLESLHKTSVRELSKGLFDLGVLSGGVDTAVKKRKYASYFMHRTGHFLGLDVHDVSPPGPTKDGSFLPEKEIKLEEGFVFTVEPGLYFDQKDSDIPKDLRGIGIRLEQDVLVTKDGCKVLSETIPLKRSEFEQILG